MLVVLVGVVFAVDVLATPETPVLAYTSHDQVVAGERLRNNVVPLIASVSDVASAFAGAAALTLPLLLPFLAGGGTGVVVAATEDGGMATKGSDGAVTGPGESRLPSVSDSSFRLPLRPALEVKGADDVEADGARW